MSDPSWKDRRVHPRKATDLTVQGTPEQGGVVARMVARNLSVGGLYCTSTVDFPEMTRLAVRLMLPLTGNGDNRTAPLDVEAVVVRREEVNGSSGATRYELGLYFTKIEDVVRNQLKQYIDDN